ncbi:MAG: AAA family ATPase, partial [Glaciimonas sp.]|nr:AAA family ATPase [Glaciimonas sp.]
MRIISITIKNFLCYHGEDNRIEFTEGLNLILGANGYGKSKLYDAFQWVFKDGITNEALAPAMRYTAELGKALVNEKALADAEEGTGITCEVCVEVTRGPGSTFQLIRQLRVAKLANGELKAADKSKFIVKKKDVLEFKPLGDDDAEKERNGLIPSEVMPYVWFQGERGVSNIIDTSRRESLRNVVNRLSDTQKWDDFIEITKQAHSIADREFTLALTSDTSQRQKATAFQQQRQRVQESLETVEQEILAVENNLDKATQKHENIAGQLAAAQKINDLKKNREIIGAELRRAMNRYDTLKLGFTKRLFTDYWVLMGTEDLVTQFEQKYSDYEKLVRERKVAAQVARNEAEREQTRLPVGVPDRVTVQNMLRDEHCQVCDRPAEKGSPAYLAIEKLLVKPQAAKPLESLPNIEQELRTLYRVGMTMQDKYGNATEQIRATYQEQADLEGDMRELEEQVKSLEEEIATEVINSGLEAKDAAGMIESIRTANHDSNTYAVQLAGLRGAREKYMTELDEIRSGLTKLGEASKIDPKLEKKRKLLYDMRELAVRMKTSQYEKLIGQLETTANEHFKSMNEPTGAFYGKIKFVRDGDVYVPQIQDDAGRQVENLNTSQTSSSKLAIIMAIVTANQNKDLANQYPLIADAPISDFDAVKANAFLAETARAFGQSIVIVKDFLEADPKQIGHYQADTV